MLVNLRAHLNFFYYLIILFLAGIFVTLLLLETVLSVVHYPAHRRGCLGSYLHQIKFDCVCQCLRFLRAYYAAFVVTFIDEKNLDRPNIGIYAGLVVPVYYGVTPPECRSCSN